MLQIRLTRLIVMRICTYGLYKFHSICIVILCKRIELSVRRVSDLASASARMNGRSLYSRGLGRSRGDFKGGRAREKNSAENSEPIGKEIGKKNATRTIFQMYLLNIRRKINSRLVRKSLARMQR